MLQQFQVSAELQQFLSGVESSALANVTWNIVFPDDAPLLPTNPSATRRSLMFSRVGATVEATPVEEYNCWLANLDFSDEREVTYPRGT